MQNKSIVLSIIFLFFFNHSYAQNVPGYLGKKAILDYQFSTPILAFLLADSKTNFFHEVHFSYVVGRKGQIGVGLETYNLKGENDSSSSFRTNVNGNALSLNYDLYYKNSLAPVGSYLRLELKYNFGDYIENEATIFEERGTYKLPQFGIGYGIRRIFYDRLVFNVGGMVAWNATGLGNGSISGGHEVIISQANFIRLNIGLGVLLF